jgi:threonyl-tRNA synthetase
MIKITFPDDSSREYKKGITAIDIAKDISPGFAKNVLSANFEGKIIESSTKICENGKIIFFTWQNSEGKKAFWHSSAHVLAQSILSIYPKAKLTIGPPIDSGFYYDVDFGNVSFSDNDLLTLEKRFMEFASQKFEFKMRSVKKKDAIEFYKKENNLYKLELIEDLKDGEITFCDHSDFTDLCKGGHIPNTGFIKAVKLLNIAGAYWKGNEKNKQLTRVYGISFPKQKELSEYLKRIEEAKKRDHRKLGKELELFTFSEKVGQGLPLWLPKGTILRENLETFLKKAQNKAGYKQVISPHIGNKELYMVSGHYEKYGQDSFQPIQTPSENETFLLKPMNCPHHCEIFNSRPYSYKELPVRFAEFGTVYRYEQSGELHGLTRVRGFTQDDAHIFCAPEQLLDEFAGVIDLVLYVFESLGFNDFEVQVSLRDKNNPDKYIGDDLQWDLAEKAILDSANQKKLNYSVELGEAAFYGPKLDFMVKDVLGRRWQLGTIQVDYNLPERFNLSYKGKDNELHRPVMIHRAPFGSMERFVAILLEQTAGDFPLWLTPNQVSILIVSEKYEKYGDKVLNFLEKNDIRTSFDNRNETIGKKIRDAELKKIPYMLILGEKESNKNNLSVRKRKEGDLGQMSTNDFVSLINEELSKSIAKFEN